MFNWMIDILRKIYLESRDIIKSRVAVPLGTKETYRDGSTYIKTENGWRKVYGDKDGKNPSSSSSSKGNHKQPHKGGGSEKADKDKTDKPKSPAQIKSELSDLAAQIKKIAGKKFDNIQELQAALFPIILNFVRKHKELIEHDEDKNKEQTK